MSFLWSNFILPDPNNDLVQCMHCITYTVLDVFWIDATWSWGLTAFILFMALYVSEVVGGVVTIRGSGTNPLASESKESGRFSEESLIQC